MRNKERKQSGLIQGLSCTKRAVPTDDRAQVSGRGQWESEGPGGPLPWWQPARQEELQTKRHTDTHSYTHTHKHNYRHSYTHIHINTVTDT